MPSTYTTSNRLEKQAAGENNNTWGDRLNDNVIAMVDEALDGVTAFSLSGSKTLSTANAATDESRKRVINITGGSGGTVTIPNLEKCYLVRNASSGTVTFTTGSGTTATVSAGAVAWVFSTGSNAIYSAQVGAFGAQNISTSGSILSSGGAIGYSTGAGGAVTQLTSKSTSVTINKLCGRITMHNAALAANTSVSFAVSNNTVSGTGTDVLACSLAGVPPDRYQYSTTMGNAGFDFQLRNITGGSLGEAVVINFAIIKAVNV